TLHMYPSSSIFFSFFFTDTPTTDIYTLSLHDALPILSPTFQKCLKGFLALLCGAGGKVRIPEIALGLPRGHQQRTRNHFPANRIVLHLRDGDLIEIDVRVGMISQLETRDDPLLQQRHPRISFSGHVPLLFVDKPGGGSAMGFQDGSNRLVVPLELAQFPVGRWPRRNRPRQIIHGNGDSPLELIASCDFALRLACP